MQIKLFLLSFAVPNELVLSKDIDNAIRKFSGIKT